jgi:death-on-curing protein
VTARKPPRWVTRALVQAIHTDQIHQHGGSYGLRDEGALESALARPQNRWHYEDEATLSALAASYAFGLARNHPFIDGNKRTAFQTMYAFLGLNGWRIRAEEDDAAEVMENVASGEIDEAKLAEWLDNHLVRRRRGRT